ncbi:hypothetical protein DE146DRAFT_221801 [Phaeosphaeria sp. MPI-PUGE-AT-0046c]|nr:hypothetical protein DE146DRAFT_221801 [Phaeosphaeria sp. MPI-PUGE-AT-0046c]
MFHCLYPPAGIADLRYIHGRPWSTHHGDSVATGSRDPLSPFALSVCVRARSTFFTTSDTTYFVKLRVRTELRVHSFKFVEDARWGSRHSGKLHLHSHNAVHQHPRLSRSVYPLHHPSGRIALQCMLSLKCLRDACRRTSMLWKLLRGTMYCASQINIYQQSTVTRTAQAAHYVPPSFVVSTFVSCAAGYRSPWHATHRLHRKIQNSVKLGFF